MTPRLASSIKVSALLRRVDAAGGFGAVLARGDATAGSIAIVTRERGETRLLAPMLAMSGGYEWLPVVEGEAIPAWIDRARQNDPDLWIVELDIPDAARFVAETLAAS
ncbi:DUF1491 family protein [Sandarakinorhabdus sp. DWP1-3-1]|uniref:DUF1491 family protein n=1 Tax=Sandarakinorhabdus sp. DWP1-3-1 TaxID=2804627 RepID=UPI003CF77FF2